MSDKSPELDPIFAQLQSDAWDKALDGIDSEKARAIIVQLFARLPETGREALVRELDAIAHPWGEPGDVPDSAGDYWALAWEGGPPAEVFVEWRIARFRATDKALADVTWQRFRKRWTPEAP